MDNLGAMVVIHTYFLSLQRTLFPAGIISGANNYPRLFIKPLLRCRSPPVHLQTLFCFASLPGGTGMENTQPKPTKTSSSKGLLWLGSTPFKSEWFGGVPNF